MTIGIIASGPNAGLAVFRALSAVERIGSGAIGGFAAFAAIDGTGSLFRAETQRGGTATLFVAGEETGVRPPPAVAAATMAAVMASGPDRPAPLSQFVAASAEAGLVTGHRLPNATGVNGRAVNLEVLERLSEGMTAMEAVQRVMADNPEADAGVIACDRHGRVGACNSRRVAARPDLGHHRREDRATGAVAEVLHNAIAPVESLAAMATEIAMEVMAPRHRSAGSVIVRAGLPVHIGTANRVVTDEAGEVLWVETTDGLIVTGRHNCAAIYLGAEVLRDGQLVGRTLMEPNVVVENGHVVSLSGQAEVEIGYEAAASISSKE